MMKLLGAHQNIVSLVGCCTLQEHKFLVIDYVPFGDLLQWLRRKRSTVGIDYMHSRVCCEGKIHSPYFYRSFPKYISFIIHMHIYSLESRKVSSVRKPM